MFPSLSLAEFTWNGNDWVWNGTRAGALDVSDVEGSGDYYDNDDGEYTYDTADTEIDTGFSATPLPQDIGVTTATNTTATNETNVFHAAGNKC